MTSPAQTGPTSRPEVIIDFIFDEGILLIAVANIGDRPALRVSVNFEPPFCGADGAKVSSQALFRNIEFLAPQKTITTLLDSSAEYFRRGEPARIEAHVSYSDAAGAKYAETIRHDLEIYRHIAYVVRPQLS